MKSMRRGGGRKGGVSGSRVGRGDRSRHRPRFDALEGRQVLSATASGVGVNALAVGDVNGDRLVDVAVAGRHDGHYDVIIYDGHGKTDASGGTVTNVLARLVDPLGPGVGPLTVALGDFNGDGVSDLAVASTSAFGNSPVVKTWSFQLKDPTALPLDAPVTQVPLGTAIAPAGLQNTKGLEVAAVDVDGDGTDELIVAPAVVGGSLDVYRFSKSDNSWVLAGQWNLKSLGMSAGVSLAAGSLDASGAPEIVLGSRVGDTVKVLDASTGAVKKTLHPLGSFSHGVRVATVSAVNDTGALVVTPRASGNGAPAPVLVRATDWKSRAFLPSRSPGAGELVAAGGGWVYPRSSVKDLSGPFPYSEGPVAPAVFLASTRGNTLVVQGFANGLSPDSADTVAETILTDKGSATKFTPLQEPGDMPGLPKTEATPLVAFPSSPVYRSPYRIELPGADPSVAKGLIPTTLHSGTNTDGWGPGLDLNAPPTVPSGLTHSQAADWLRQRLLTAYSRALGVAYQHHHDPFWQPQQGSLWNTVALGYQSPGIDCTNFTAYAYNSALGIRMNAATGKQASISPSNLADITIPESIAPYVNVQILSGPSGTTAADYKAFIDQLKPGDILYINPSHTAGQPSDPSSCTHAITWLGNYGKDSNNAGVPLIIDSTGNAPTHYDSNNRVIQPGVQIRPFGAPGGANQWYFLHVDHVLRIIAD